jgi:hypothetical protein
MGIIGAMSRPRVALIFAVLAATIGLSATPAAAETTLDVSTPADGRYQPGRVTPLLVTIEADRAVAGTLNAVFDGFNAGSMRVEVPGGSAKEVVFSVAIPPWSGSGSVTFTGDNADDNARAGINLLPAGGDELVAVLPELAARDLPATAGLATDIGVARLIPLDVELLDTGRDVLGPFTQMLATADDLQSLEGERLDAIGSWVGSEGGHLIVDDELGSPIPIDLGEERPATGSASQDEVVNYGLGQIRFTAGAAASGDYDGLIKATPTRSVDEFPWGGGFGGGFPTTTILASDAGVRIPEIGSIVLMLIAYTLIAGPLLWFVLRRARREPMLWLVLPALALLTTGVVYVLGQAIRDETSTAHGTLIADLPTERNVSSQVLVTAPNGGTAGVTLGEGWRPVRVTSEEMFFDGPFGQNTQSEAVLRGNDLSIDLPPGGVGVVGAETAEEAVAPSWSYELEADGGDLVGTVTNLTVHDLEDAFVSSGSGFDRIGSVGAGESVEITLRNVSSPPINGDPLIEQLWRNDPFDGDRNGASNPGVLVNWMSSKPELRLPGFVVIVGWTREEAGPLRTSGGAEVVAGRTAFLTADRLADDAISASTGQVEFLRGWNSTRVDDVPGNGCTDFPVTLRIIPALEVLDGDPVLATSTRAVAALDVWTGDAWEPAGMAAAPAGEVAIAVPDSALATGSLTVRTQMSCDFWGMSDPFPALREATSDDDVLTLGALDRGTPDDDSGGSRAPTTTEGAVGVTTTVGASEDQNEDG